MTDTKELVERLRKIADASRRADGTDIPLGQELRSAADAIERLERERDEWRDAAHLSACEAHSGLLEETEAEAATLRSRVAKMEKALRAARTQITFWKATADKVPGHASSMPFIEPSAAAIEQIDTALTEEPKP